MKSLAVAVALGSALTAGSARAQNAGSEPTLILILGPPTLISLALDVVLLGTLVNEGTAGRGRSITTTVFSGIAMAISAICLVVGLGSPFTTDTWTGLSSGALAVGVGSLAVSIYALLHPEPEPEEPATPPQFEHLYRPPPPRDLPPQL